MQDFEERNLKDQCESSGEQYVAYNADHKPIEL